MSKPPVLAVALLIGLAALHSVKITTQDRKTLQVGLRNNAPRYGMVLAELPIGSEIGTIETYLGQFDSVVAVSDSLSHYSAERIRSCG